jgi:hypothetical protein
VGDSLLPYVRDETSNPDADRYIFAQASGTKVMVCNRQYKLIRYLESGKEELFNREVDPGETENRAGIETEVCEKLADVLDHRLELIEREQITRTEEVEMTEDVNRRLEQLGYK